MWTVSYRLYFNADLFEYVSKTSLCSNGVNISVSRPKTDSEGTYVNFSCMDEESEGITLPKGDIVALTFAVKAEVNAVQAASFRAAYENGMASGGDPVSGLGAGPAATVTVTRDYSVTLPEGFDGAATVGHGEDYTFTAQQDPHYDYSFAGSTMGGQSVSVSKNDDGSFTVSNVTGDLIIRSDRTPKTYTVTVTGNGAADATAAAAAAYKLGLVESRINVNQPGGMIQIDMEEDGTIYMTGTVGYIADISVAESFFS